MSKKLIYTLIASLAIGGIIFYLGIFIMNGRESVKDVANGEVVLNEIAPEVEQVLNKRIALVEILLKDPEIINEVNKSSDEHKDITLGEILELDERWRSTEGVDEFIRAFLTNNTAIKLIEFQEENPGFSEVFVTDEKGLNVGQTNKTTDYYQADEDWWVEAYNNGLGKTFYSAIEFDESAQTEAISLYVPIREPETGRVIGVSKSVVSIASIKLEL